MDETNQDQVAPPLIPIDPRELHLQNRGGPPLDTGIVLPVDPRDGRPLVDSREVRQVERELKDAEHRERAGAPHPGPREVNNIGHKSGPREVVFVPVDAKDGTPVDPRSVRKVEPAAPAPREGPPAQALDARDLLRPVERMELRGERARDPNHGAAGAAQAREVVFIPVDAKDGTPVDPRRVHQVDAHDGRPLDPRVPAAAAHARPGPGQELREVRSVHESPRELLGDRPRVELREVRPVHPARDGPVPVDGSELRPVDPRNMMRHGDRVDPHGLRTSELPGLLGRRDDLRPVDPRVGMQMDPRNGRPVLDARDMDPRDGRAAAAAYGPSEAPQGVRGLTPEGLSPVRTGRDSREVHFSPRRTGLSPTHAPRDMGSRSPRDEDYSNRAPSPRQHAPDYGPRSPRDDTGRPDYGPRSPRGYYSGSVEYGPPISPRSSRGPLDYSGPRSPRARAADYDFAGPSRASAMRPALDRELSFTEFGPGYADVPGAAAMDRVGHAAGRAVPLPYEPLDPRDSSAVFDFHGGGGGVGGAAPRPRSPRPEQPLLVRGYGDIDPRQFRPPGAEPRVLLDVTHELPSGNNTRAGIRYDDSRNYMDDPAMRDRDDPMTYRRGTRSLEGSPRRQQQQHVSQYSEFRKGEADILRDYQPKESYFSDYHPSQNYQPGPLATQDMDDFPVTNPNYKKHLSVGPDHF